MIELVVLGLLAGCVSIGIVHTKGAWLLRAALISALVVSIIVSALPKTDDGAPTTATPPQDAELVGCFVDEKGGSIYLWLLQDGEPHGYTQPYTTDLHAVCVVSAAAGAQGVRVALHREDGPPPRRVRGQKIPKNHFRPYTLPPANPGTKEAA